MDAIRNGAVPCIQSVVDSTARLENERAIRECVELYETRFAETVRLPTEAIEELSNCNDICEQEATRRFLKLAVFDDEGIYYGRLMVWNISLSLQSQIRIKIQITSKKYILFHDLQILSKLIKTFHSARFVSLFLKVPRTKRKLTR